MVPIVVFGSLNAVAKFPHVVPIVVFGSPNVVPEFPNVIPVVVSECLDLRMWCLNFPMWCPLWCLDLSM